MSQEKLEILNTLNQLQGDEYYNYFKQIARRIDYSQKEQLLEYEQILDKATQPNQNDSKSCPRTRQQTCRILRELISLRKKTLKTLECYEIWINRNVPNKQLNAKPQTNKSSSIFSPIWSLFKFGKKETNSQQKNQQKSSQKQFQEKQQIDSKQDEEMKGLLNKVDQSQENFNKKSSKKESNTEGNKTKLTFDNKAKFN